MHRKFEFFTLIVSKLQKFEYPTWQHHFSYFIAKDISLMLVKCKELFWGNVMILFFDKTHSIDNCSKLGGREQRSISVHILRVSRQFELESCNVLYAVEFCRAWLFFSLYRNLPYIYACWVRRTACTFYCSKETVCIREKEIHVDTNCLQIIFKSEDWDRRLF